MYQTGETTTTQGEQDSESVDSGDLYLNIPRSSNRTDGILPQRELKASVSPDPVIGDFKEKSHRRFRKYGAISLILLLFIGLGVLTYMVVELKHQLKSGHDLRAKQNEDFKKQSHEKDKTNSKELQILKTQLLDLSNVTRSIIFDFDHLKKLIGEERPFWERVPKKEHFQTLKGALCHANACSDLEILGMIETAYSNDLGKYYIDMRSVKLLFEIFKNDIPSFVETFEAQHYETMYKTLKKLLEKSIQDDRISINDDTCVIAAFFEMYGKVIVSYERYLGRHNINGIYYTSCGLFNQAIEYFHGLDYPFDDKKQLDDLKRITDLEEEIISSHFKDEESSATLHLIRVRTMENIRLLKQKQRELIASGIYRQWEDTIETLA